MSWCQGVCQASPSLLSRGGMSWVGCRSMGQETPAWRPDEWAARMSESVWGQPSPARYPRPPESSRARDLGRGRGEPSPARLQGFVKEPSVQPDLPAYPFHAFLSKWRMFPRHTPRAFAGCVSFFWSLPDPLGIRSILESISRALLACLS